MADVTAKIELYHRLFLICLGFAVLSLALTLILFFALDICTVLGYLTGRSAKKKIRELEAGNAKSGRLRPKSQNDLLYRVQEEQETALLQEKQAPDADTELLISSTVVWGKFTVERELILIHTEEVI